MSSELEKLPCKSDTIHTRAANPRPTYTLRSVAFVFGVLGVAFAAAGYWFRTPATVLTITADPGTEIFIGSQSFGTVPVRLSEAQLQEFVPKFKSGTPIGETTFEVHPLGRMLGKRSGETVWCKVPTHKASRFYICETPWGDGVPSFGSGVHNGVMTFNPHVRQQSQDRHARTFRLAENEVNPLVECELQVEVMLTEGLERYAALDGSNVRVTVYKVGVRKYTIHELLLNADDESDGQATPPFRYTTTFPAPEESGDYCVLVAVASTNPDVRFKWAPCHDIRRLRVR